MAYRIFQVSMLDPASGERDLNGFLGSHKVLAVDKAFVDLGGASFWTFCVDFQPSVQNRGAETRGGPKVDYKDVLTPEQFGVFSKLRDLRKTLAVEEGVPVYSVFTNAQLAAMVQREVANLAGLKGIEGVGEARVQKHGARILDCLLEKTAREEAP